MIVLDVQAVVLHEHRTQLLNAVGHGQLLHTAETIVIMIEKKKAGERERK